MVFATELLPASHTFIRDHVENVRAMPTVTLGVHRVPGLDMGQLDTVVLPPSRVGRLLLWLFGTSAFLDRVVREKGVTAIHAHFADAGMKIARFARRHRLPLIVTLHGADVLRIRQPSAPQRLLNAYLRRGMMEWTSLFLPVSDHIRDAALASGYPAERLRKHILGIPLPDHDRQPRLRAVPAVPVILFVGRFVEKKGLKYLIQACRRLADEGCRFKLNIAGDGPLAAEVKAEASGLEGVIEFLGLLPPPQVREQLEAADIF